MTTHRLITAFTLTAIVAGGCQNHQPATTRPSAAVAVKTTPLPARSDLPPSDARNEEPVFNEQPRSAPAVAQRASSYAQHMSPYVDRTIQPAGSAREVSKSDEVRTHGDSNVVDTEPLPRPRTNEFENSSAALPNTGLSIGHTADNAVQSSVKVVASANVPTSVPLNVTVLPQPASNAPDVDELGRRLAQRVKDYPQDVGNQFDYQLLQFVRGDVVGDARTLVGLPGEDREMLQAIMDGLSNFRNGARADNNMLLSRKIRPMVEMSDRLRSQAELTIPVVALCSKVYKYGSYDSIEPARFTAGTEHEIIVYCEVENFASQLDSNKLWDTKLTQELVIYSEPGQKVWQADKVAPAPVVDYSRTRRHDFFLARKIKLPANLSIGRYTIKATIVDHVVNRVTENSIPLDIVAQ